MELGMKCCKCKAKLPMSFSFTGKGRCEQCETKQVIQTKYTTIVFFSVFFAAMLIEPFGLKLLIIVMVSFAYLFLSKTQAEPDDGE